MQRNTPTGGVVSALGKRIWLLLVWLVLLWPLGAEPLTLDQATLQAALNQVVQKHRDLLQPLLDPNQSIDDALKDLIGDGQLKLEQEAGASFYRAGKLRIQVQAGLKHEDEVAGGITRPFQMIKGQGGDILIIFNSDRNGSMWQLKDTMIHELAHALLMRLSARGYWKSDGGQVEDRGPALACHECCCYVINMGILQRLACEFPEQRAAIHARLLQKLKILENRYFARAIALGQVQDAQQLAAMLSRFRDDLQQAKLSALADQQARLQALLQRQNENQQQIQELKRALGALEAEVKKATLELHRGNDADKPELRKVRDQFQARLRELQQQLDRLKATASQLDKEKKELLAQGAWLEKALSRQYAALFKDLSRAQLRAHRLSLEERLGQMRLQEQQAAAQPLGPSRGSDWRQAVDEGLVSVVLQGQARTAGTVFRARIHLLVPTRLQLTLPAGSVVQCDLPGVQNMLVASSLQFELSPQQPSLQHDLEGYCLDPLLRPPPLDPSAFWRLAQPAPHHGPALAIVQAAEALHRRGQLHRDLGARHLQTVIQRALWHWRMPERFDVQRLRADLLQQVERGEIPVTSQQIDDLVDHLWLDVERVLHPSVRRAEPTAWGTLPPTHVARHCR